MQFAAFHKANLTFITFAVDCGPENDKHAFALHKQFEARAAGLVAEEMALQELWEARKRLVPSC
jgi:hypothetical protein